MNKERRNEVQNIVNKLELILDELRELADAEEEAMDNVPESLQGTERYEAMEEALGLLQEKSDDLDGLIYDLTDLAEAS